MNDQLKREHFKRVTGLEARRMYNRLCDACDSRPDGMTDADQMLVSDIAYGEQLKQLLMDDVAERGIGKEVRNGRQTYYQENKSLAQIRAICDQQRKQMAELKLTPSGRKAAAVELDDEFDRFS